MIATMKTLGSSTTGGVRSSQGSAAGERAEPFLGAGRPRRQTRPLRVVIADDHPLYRDGVARAISEKPGLQLVGQAADGWGALFLIRKVKPDVGVVDVKMAGMDGIEVC